MESSNLSAERRALLERALADPASITPAEKNEILLLPPPDVERELLISTFQIASRDELVAKALPNGGADLNHEEARWLSILGVKNPFERLTMDESLARFGQRIRRPNDVQELESNAMAAVLTPDENRAIREAWNQLDRLNEKRQQARSEREAEIRELHKLPRAKWIQEMLDAALPRWGFVIVRTAYGDGNDSPCSDAAWDRFQAFFKDAGGFALHLWKGGKDLWETHESVWVSDRETMDGADTATLRAQVRAMRAAGQIPEGVRRDIFLVVDENVLRNEQFRQNRRIMPLNPRGTIRLRAVDPDHDPAVKPVPTEGPYEGFDGEISVPLPKVFDWLYYTFFAGSESWTLRYHQTKVEGEGRRTRRVAMRNKPIMPYPAYEL
ncbi:hypothetical protein QBC42DRAFT_323749 [Cladorrhinum samala]|uniref:Uncharacterized protein n=1 Tax=Cladorrhinum samala TaxID=585594 RepID=A0AAV9HSD8_9PEZI|nr:hypothetical protein QBC42DRAFT_323749 [Cladorrhinum samala]